MQAVFQHNTLALVRVSGMPPCEIGVPCAVIRPQILRQRNAEFPLKCRKIRRLLPRDKILPCENPFRGIGIIARRIHREILRRADLREIHPQCILNCHVIRLRDTHMFILQDFRRSVKRLRRFSAIPAAVLRPGARQHCNNRRGCPRSAARPAPGCRSRPPCHRAHRCRHRLRSPRL